MLGIKFSINLPETIDLNYRPILIKVRNIINQWKQRKLTPIGRLVVIKTLIIPKPNLLILTLPNPSKDFFYRCRKRTISLIQDYKFGGLKIIDIIEFTHELKSIWMRRLLSQKNKLDQFIRS